MFDWLMNDFITAERYVYQGLKYGQRIVSPIKKGLTYTMLYSIPVATSVFGPEGTAAGIALATYAAEGLVAAEAYDAVVSNYDMIHGYGSMIGGYLSPVVESYNQMIEQPKAELQAGYAYGRYMGTRADEGFIKPNIQKM